MKRITLIAVAIAVSAAALPATAAQLTARSSGVQAIKAGPGNFYATIGKLRNNERVTVERCTRQARWCLIDQLDSGPSGWVDGSYLIGSPAKNAVTPFEFSFDPLWPGRGLRQN
jgi:uncharacterized protein YraI